MTNFQIDQQVRITELYADNPEDDVMSGKTGRVVEIHGRAYIIRIDEGQGVWSGKTMMYDDDTLERVNPKRRITMYAIGERTGVEDGPFREALASGRITSEREEAAHIAQIKQSLIGDDRTIGIWGFDVFVDPDNLPNYWNA